MSKKVSIITPIYNGEKYLYSWANYVVSQDYDSIQVIIVNDGSTDNTSVILHKKIESLIVMRGYECIIIDQENKGPSGAINSALQVVSGEYLMLYDCDDVLMKSAVKEKVDFLDKYTEYAMVRNNGYFVKDKNLAQNSYLFVRKKKEKQNEKIFEDVLFGKTNNWTSTYMVRTKVLWECLKGREIYNSSYGQNMQIILPVAYSNKTGFIDKPLMRYVDYGTGMSRVKTYDKENEMIRGYMEIRIEILKRIPMSDNKRQKYIEEVKKMYDHIFLRLASQYTEKETVRELFSVIKQNGDLKIKDFFYYIQGNNPIFTTIGNNISFILQMIVCILFKVEGKLFRHDSIY